MACAVCIAFLTFISPALAASADDVKKEIGDLLRDLPADPDPAWRDDAEKLRAKLAALKSVDPIAAAATRAGELETSLKSAPAVSSTNGALLGALHTLGDAAAKVEGNEPAAAFTTLTTRLQTLVASTGFPNSNPGVQSEVQQLRDLVTKLQPGAPRLHIVEASFGAPPRRLCDATPSLLTSCERKASCTLPASLCGGFDPAPSADNSIKGADIEYQCVIGGDDLWAKLNSSDRSTAPGVPVRRTLLRGATESLACLATAQ